MLDTEATNPDRQGLMSSKHAVSLALPTTNPDRMQRDWSPSRNGLESSKHVVGAITSSNRFEGLPIEEPAVVIPAIDRRISPSVERVMAAESGEQPESCTSNKPSAGHSCIHRKQWGYNDGTLQPAAYHWWLYEERWGLKKLGEWKRSFEDQILCRVGEELRKSPRIHMFLSAESIEVSIYSSSSNGIRALSSSAKFLIFSSLAYL